MSQAETSGVDLTQLMSHLDGLRKPMVIRNARGEKVADLLVADYPYRRRFCMQPPVMQSRTDVRKELTAKGFVFRRGVRRLFKGRIRVAD